MALSTAVRIFIGVRYLCVPWASLNKPEDHTLNCGFFGGFLGPEG
jgi:hypothetical protein